MHTHSAEALVLRTYRYGEADRIVVFLTEDRGKKRGVAKNATSSRRRFGAALEPLTLGRVSYVEREHRELVRLDRIEPLRTPLRAVTARSGPDALEALSHAAYLAELVDEWAPDSSPNPRLFRLAVAIAAWLGEGGSVDALARYFEYWLLRLEGVYPPLDACPRCGQASLADGAALSAHDRTYVCLACAMGSEPALSPAAIVFLRGLGRQTPAQAARADLPQRVLREVERTHQRLLALHLEKDLRSPRVIAELRPSS